MSIVRTWILGVIGTALLLSLASSLFPKGKYEVVSSFVTGLILLLVMVRPLFSIDFTTLPEIQGELAGEIADSAAAQQEELSHVISEKTAAYIQNKASSMGVVCQAKVCCTIKDGVPYPHEVWLDIDYDGQLSALITTDLAIDRERQYWKETA